MATVLTQEVKKNEGIFMWTKKIMCECSACVAFLKQHDRRTDRDKTRKRLNTYLNVTVEDRVIKYFLPLKDRVWPLYYHLSLRGHNLTLALCTFLELMFFGCIFCWYE